MKLPKIGLNESEFSRESLENWLAAKTQEFDVVESNSVKALFMPVASSEMCSLMVVQTLRQITKFSSYKRVVVIGAAHPKVAAGIYLPDCDAVFRNEITEFSMVLEPELRDAVMKLNTSTQISSVSTDFFELCDLSYNLPIIADMTAEYMLPIIPVAYKKADRDELLEIIELLIDNGSLIILCGGLSHSLSIRESKSLDSETISKIIALDSSIRNVQSNCYAALNSLIQLAENHYWRPRLISYQTTGNKYNIKNTAGYASMVFFNQ